MKNKRNCKCLKASLLIVFFAFLLNRQSSYGQNMPNNPDGKGRPGFRGRPMDMHKSKDAVLNH